MEESSFQAQPVESETQPTKPWLKIVGFSLLGLLLVTGLVWAGYWYGMKNEKVKTKNEKLELKTENLTPTLPPVVTTQPTFPSGPIFSSDETTGWKTYRDEKYGFEFRYPQNFQVVEGLGQYFLNQKPVIELQNEVFNYLHNQIDAYLTVSVKSSAESECEYVPRGNIGSLQNKVIDGITFTMFSSTGAATGNTYSNTIFHHLKDITCYEIVTTIHEASDGSTPEALPKIIEQKSRLISQFDLILSTFKFLD